MCVVLVCYAMLQEATSLSEKARTNIYAEKQTLQTFKEICQREGESMSGKLEALMQQYNQSHSPGNPQLTMTSYVKPEEPQPMRVQCAYIGGAIADGRVYCRRAGMWLAGVKCYSCERNSLRKQK